MTCYIKKARSTDVSDLSNLIRKAYRDVAERFQLTPGNCPKHPSNCTDDWIENDIARELDAKKISIGIIAKQTDLKQWYQQIGFTEGEIKEFGHLPFKVCFMSYDL